MKRTIIGLTLCGLGLLTGKYIPVKESKLGTVSNIRIEKQNESIDSRTLFVVQTEHKIYTCTIDKVEINEKILSELEKGNISHYDTYEEIPNKDRLYGSENVNPSEYEDGYFVIPTKMWCPKEDGNVEYYSSILTPFIYGYYNIEDGKLIFLQNTMEQKVICSYDILKENSYIYEDPITYDEYKVLEKKYMKK